MSDSKVPREVVVLDMARHAAGASLRVVRSPVWSELATPITRSAGWYVQTARRHRAALAGLVTVPSIPDVAPDLGLAAQAMIDELILAVARLSHRPREAEEMHRIEREVNEALRLYGREGWLDEPAAYHGDPPPPAAPRIRGARTLSLGYEVLSFESGYAPHPDEPGRDRYLADQANATAYAWVLRHDEPRPWIVCVHGAGMGLPFADLHIFRAEWLHRVLGLNVAMPIQARHGPRRAGSPFGVGFPADDLMDNVHAVAQSVWDIRRVLAWIREQGDERIGVQGLSLGGYTTALLAGLDEDLACVIVGVPAIDLADLMDRHVSARFRSHEGYENIGALARSANRVVSPLAIAPLVPRDRRFIYAGLADRMVHPLRQVHALWEHWDEPAINWFRGSHVGFFLSRPVHDFLGDALRRSGLVDAEVR
ncbi:MAG: hypothetical protein U0V73_10590 [Acidimicrobiia bacterium]